MLRLIVFLLYSGLTLISTSPMASPLVADEVRRELGGSAEISFLRDPDGNYSIGDVSAPDLALNFQPLTRGVSFGYTQDVVWLRITLQRAKDAPTDWLIEVTNPYINDLRFFSPNSNGFDVAQAGDRYPFQDRQFSFYNPVFRVGLPDDSVRTFYLRFDTDSSTAATLLLWQPAALRDAGQAELLTFGSFIGMMAMSLLFTLLNWMISRNRFLLSFASLTAILILMVPTQIGLTTQFFITHSPLIADALVPWTLAIAIASIMLTFRQPLQIPKNYPWLDKTLWAGSLISLLAPLSREVDLYWLIGGPLLQLLFMTGLLLNGWASLRQWRMKHSGGIYFFAAHAIFISSLIIGRLVWLGLMPSTSWSSLSWIPGLLAFLLLSHIGVIVEAHTSSQAHHFAENAARNAQELAKQERRLREEQTVFFSLVAHELRTPLGVIVAGLKNLERQLADSSAETQARLARLWRAADRLGALVESQLQLQRLASANFFPQVTQLPPAEAAAEALLQARETYPQRVFELSSAIDLPATAPLDAELVIIALTNLLSNAAKYSLENTPVRLEISAHTMLHYKVIDCGPGIAPAERERLFGVYQRSSVSRGQAGFGIGLATAHRIAVVHGGTLEYEDGTTGGAIFTLSLPLVKHFPTVAP